MGLKNIISVEEGWNTLMRFYVPNIESVENYKLPELKLVEIKQFLGSYRRLKINN
ncbi:hypothetical protein [Psychrilyobacter atlanticus]|uniref:hypothetical protein n=1 Tax=Psychrilyobacter atlanticus TaxID=271091 RepID=UPI000413549E|nr:hypothetical protein [Psychrilyobacter atlanticus]